MNDYREVAQPVGEDEGRSLRVELITRPLRTAFIIRRDLALEHLAEIIEYNSATWGGRFSLLVPTDGETIDELWWGNLRISSPDKIVLCANNREALLSAKLADEIAAKLQPFSCRQWTNWPLDIAKRHEERIPDGVANGIPMLYPLKYYYDSLKGPLEPEESNVRVPKIDQGHPFHLAVAAQVGTAPGIYGRVYRDVFQAQEITFDSTDLGDCLEKLAELDSHATPLSFAGLYARASYSLGRSSERPSGLVIVLAGNSPVDDVCLFWSLRYVGVPLGGEPAKQVMIPMSMLRSARSLRALAQAIGSEGHWHAHSLALMSEYVNRRRMAGLRERLMRYLPQGIVVKLVTNPSNIAEMEIKSIAENRNMTLDHERFEFSSVAPDFGNQIRIGEWAIRVKPHPPRELPMSSRLNDMLCASPAYARWGCWTRYADGELICLTDRLTKFGGGRLPKASDAFEAVFHDHGLNACANTGHSYIEGFAKLLGSTEQLRKRGIRDLLWKMQSGATKDIDGLKSCLREGDSCEETIDTLVEQRVLFRGMEFRCAACGLRRWHPLDRLGEAVRCPGCLRLIRPPIYAPIVFRLNELASQAIGQGAIPVLLTQGVLSQQTLNRALWLYGLDVEQDSGKREIDLVSTYDGQLILAECKDFKVGVLKKDVAKALRQLSGLESLAHLVEAPIVLLATLLPMDNSGFADLAAGVMRIAKRNRGVVVHLLSLDKMEFVDLRSPDKTIEQLDLFSTMNQ